MVEQAFKWDATDYANHSSAQEIWAGELIAKLNLSGSEQVLDLGCGDGKISSVIAERLVTGNVIGIDASKDMISLAHDIYSERRNLNFKHGDAIRFLYKEKFDVIFSNAVLHWVKDHVAVLDNCYQSLRSEGNILLQMGGKGNAGAFVDVVTEVTKQSKWKSYFESFTFPYHFYSVENYESWLNSAGFEPERIEYINKDMQHEGKHGLMGWFRTTWMPYINQLPKQKRESFINNVVDNYLNEFPVDNFGNTHVKMVRLEVEAIKH